MTRNPGNSKYVKKLNRMTVLNIIKQHDTVSRQQLAKLTGLTPPAITGIIRELLEVGFVEEIGLGESEGGRKPMKIRFKAEAGYVLGVELTRHESVIGIADLKNPPNTIQTWQLDMVNPEQGLTRLAAIIREELDRSEHKGRNFLGIGIAFPGLLNVREGIVKRAVNLGLDWNDYPIRKVLEEKLALPVFIENNAKAAALAEKWFGGGVGHKDLAYINLGEGISAGVVLDDRVLQGARGYAGQIGHIVVMEQGPLCNCGNRGCLEAICGIPALLRKVNTELPLIQPDDPLAKIFQNRGKIVIDDVLTAALVEGSYAWALLREVGRNVGRATADIINMYNPEAVFIGGKLALAGDVFLEVIQEVVDTHAFPEIARSTSIKISRLDGHSGVIGACALALKQLLTGSNSAILDDVRMILERQEEANYTGKDQL